ncbi:hypothetical protein TRFO_22588 [Tritrichomonas foetus]|uniref:Uncharacterized protein n=1 Tax=Tritrichomonas foetus TaxID=1144522 RepID=A0A1J4KCX6_9EUKA|nr:hypothetical protein TRFO_22588 [Tritrichomonas foetus]|eukprot:OHT08826.1 hypothetical protein TRFO_22588 [Tritrichomonas foetus]
MRYALTMNNKIGQFAYNILMENERSILQSLVTRNSITEGAQTVFNGPPSHLFVARLAEISFLISTLSPESSLPVCQFMSQFILFGEEPDVLDLFKKIMSVNPIAQHIQNSLLHTGFISSLISSITNAHQTDHLDGVALYIIGIFKIIQMCGKSVVIGPIVKKPEYAIPLLRDFPTAPFQVKNARWQAVLAIIDKDNASSFLPILDQACRELSFGPQLYEYQIDCIHLLLRFSSFSTSVSEQMVQLNFVSLLGQILQRYPNHTIGHSIVAKAFRDTVKNPILGPHVYQLLPFIADAIPNRKQILLSATSLSLLMEMMNYAKSHPEMVQILGRYINQSHQCWNYARSAGALFASGYGGNLPEPAAPPQPGQPVPAPSAIAH